MLCKSGDPSPALMQKARHDGVCLQSWHWGDRKWLSGACILLNTTRPRSSRFMRETLPQHKQVCTHILHTNSVSCYGDPLVSPFPLSLLSLLQLPFPLFFLSVYPSFPAFSLLAPLFSMTFTFEDPSSWQGLSLRTHSLSRGE